MSWFWFALFSTLLWGGADLFYKKGADEKDKYSHLKTSICVGLVMGAHAVFLLLTRGDLHYDWRNLYLYLPVSFFYISSMTVGYLGLRYLELSVTSPIENASGAVTCVLLMIVLKEWMDVPSAVAVVLITAGVIALGVLERRAIKGEAGLAAKKYVYGWKALLFPVAYCFLDAMGTFLDGYYLDDFEKTPLVGVTEETFEDVANISYELTFLFVAIILLVYVVFIRKSSLFVPKTRSRAVAAVLETAGQFTYVYAMSDGNAVVAAPMIGAYCIVSLLLGRVFLKEKLTKWQYAAVAAVIAGIVILGVMEGLGEAQSEAEEPEGEEAAVTETVEPEDETELPFVPAEGVS